MISRLSIAEMRSLHRKVEHRVHPKEDNVRLYWIPKDALPKTLTIGSTLLEPPQPAQII